MFVAPDKPLTKRTKTMQLDTDLQPPVGVKEVAEAIFGAFADFADKGGDSIDYPLAEETIYAVCSLLQLRADFHAVNEVAERLVSMRGLCN